MNRRGVALIAVLWVVSLMGGAAAWGLVAARDAIGASANRVVARRARWQAEGCLALARRAAERRSLDPACDVILRQLPDSASTLADAGLVREIWVRVGDRIAVVACSGSLRAASDTL